MPETIIDCIYEAAAEPAAWENALDRLAHLVGAEGALLVNISDELMPLITTPGVRELYSDFFKQGWTADNIRTKALLSASKSKFISDVDQFSHEQMRDEPLYRDFLWPRGFGFAAGVSFDLPQEKIIAISIERKRDSGPIEEKHLDLLNSVGRDLRRSLILASQLEFKAVDNSLRALQLARLPTAALTAKGKILGCNTVFEAGNPRYAIAAFDQLRFLHPAAQASFEASLAAGMAAGASREEMQGAQFACPGQPGLPPAVVYLIPAARLNVGLFSPVSFFIILVPLSRSNGLTSEMIQSLMNLTRAEARLTKLLLDGEPLRDAAQALGIQLETARSQIKTVLAKTDMARQTDLIAALTSLHSLEAD
ncbi:helix-turn-helix transcriptional regulator [Agrobacterium vitis]